MIGTWIDKAIGLFNPSRGLHRAHARSVLERHYHGGEPSRFTNHRAPQNRSADAELDGPWGADSLRAWARMLVRDNAYAWGVVDTIVSSVVGCGIQTQSMVDDDEELNERRDAIFTEWARTCDVNGQYNFDEMQKLAQREIVEAGECLIHLTNVDTTFAGIPRKVPFAVELVEADRLANDRDTLRPREDGSKITRGIEFDDLGKPVAYWIYPNHPKTTGRQEPERVLAANIIHLFRQDRIGQSRGVSWFAPVVSWLRDLGTYVENELQASAVASCFTAAIKTDSPMSALGTPTSEADNTDTDSNTYDYLQPGMIMHMRPGEDISFGSPGRPNSASEPWINLILRGIAVGTGLSYETVSRDYSRTNYSSNRASQLEDRRRFRCWQKYLKDHLMQPIWDRFTEAAAIAGLDDFPTMADLLKDRSSVPVGFQATGWEWVDPAKEQSASEKAIRSNQSTLSDELGAKGKNWRKVLRQRAAEEVFKDSVGLPTARSQEETNGSQILAAIDILDRMLKGTLAEATATELLVAIGIPRDDVIKMVTAQATEAESLPPPPEPVAPPAPVFNLNPQQVDEEETVEA